MTKIIAEIGWNHIGNLNLAKKMILAAKKSGADLVKIQTFSEKRLVPGPWDNDGRRELYKKASLSLHDHIILNRFAKKNKIVFFSSVFNIEGALLLSKVQKKFVKIPSSEIRSFATTGLNELRFLQGIVIETSSLMLKKLLISECI